MITTRQLIARVWCTMCLIGTVGFLQAQNTISIDLKTQKYVGNTSDLDRAKYFNLHHTYASWELNDVAEELLDTFQIGFGRHFAGPGSGNPNQSGGVSVDFPTTTEGTTIGNSKRTSWQGNPTYFDRLTDDIIITDHPYRGFVYNGDFDKGAAYNSAYMQAAFSNSMPKYYELLNEPFVHTTDFAPWADRNLVIAQMTNLWKKTADKIHADIPGLMVGGYASAWPEMEQGNFSHWQERMKAFMDGAGSSMDFFSTHFYDGANVVGDDQNRSGSNSEAIMDLIESYSYEQFGVAKPHVISEFGKTVKEWTKDANGAKDPKPYSEQRDWSILKSMNSFTMQFMQRPDRILKTIPFITAKSNFFYSNDNPNQYPYPWVILKKESNGTYTYTHLRKYFELWKDVKGKRVDAQTTDPDLIPGVYVDGNTAYITLHNMETANKTMTLNMLNNMAGNITGVTIRRLRANASGAPELAVNTQGNLPANITLSGQETVVIICNLNSAVTFDNTIRETQYYAGKTLDDIVAGNTLSYTFSNVVTGSGNASLRMSVGRDHGLSLAPTVQVNGTTVTVPTDWIGYSQYNRSQFFGMIEIPFDISLLNAGTNTVTVNFGDTGGKLASMILTAEVIDGTSGPSQDNISLALAPTTLQSQAVLSVDLQYSATVSRDISVAFWKNQTWLASDKITVQAGTGVETMTVDLGTAPAPGTDYIWKADIRPVGAGWQDATDNDQVNGVVVTSALTDDVSLAQAPTALTPATSYTVNLDYTASAQRELVVEFWNGGSWIANGTAIVSSGSGTEPIVINLSNAPAPGSNYLWKAQIRPVGSSWQDATDTDQVTGVTVSTPTVDEVRLTQAPTVIASSTTYAVNLDYDASTSREIVLEFWNGNTWLASDVKTVSAGVGSEPMTINLSTAPSAGSNYKWKAQIRPLGTNWTSATDTDQIDNVQVTGGSRKADWTSEGLDMRIFPNPSPNKIFQVEFSEPVEGAWVEIMNLAGQQLQKLPLTDKQSIDLRNLDVPVALVRVHAGETIFSQIVRLK
ncbi:hypothetical protein [Pontibacter sp. G13]|uniref:hypothetical protein n=1 Tax=Pontibacter sp. G13 TaxID=3074898 RepID=UPI00288A2694|nr:hypothetical protein [Pontibacter sp. G13]WNJ18390.1 hypothetical protein RJD25_26345 [Pontibacter sp. G13]